MLFLIRLLCLVGLAIIFLPLTSLAQPTTLWQSQNLGLTLTVPAPWQIIEQTNGVDLLNPTHPSPTIEGTVWAGLTVRLIDNRLQRPLTEIGRLLYQQITLTEPPDSLTFETVPNLPYPAVWSADFPNTPQLFLFANDSVVYSLSLNLNHHLERQTLQPIYQQAALDLMATAEFAPPQTIGYRLEAPVQATAIEVADRFDDPVRHTDATSWGLLQAFDNFWDNPRYNSYHAGEDWYQRGVAVTAGEPVYAVANGAVVYASFANYPGEVVIIEHQLPEGEVWYSMYGHLGERTVDQGVQVRLGDHVGTVYDWPGNAHLHFEMRRFFVADVINGPAAALTRHRNYPPGPGYWPVGQFSDSEERPMDRGWIAPTEFVAAWRGQEIYGRVVLQAQPSSAGVTVQLSEAACPDRASAEQDIVTITDAVGAFTFDVEPTRTFACLWVAPDGFLTQQVRDPTVGFQGELVLLAGDLTGDQQIDIVDLSIVAARYKTVDPVADINRDGLVDIADLSIVASNYGQQSRD